MRCSEARRRLIESRGTVPADDRELKNHLLSCAPCAAFARAEQSLVRDLATASTDDDNTDDIPLSALKARVEARVDANPKRAMKEIPLMSALYRQIRKRPSLGLTAGLAAAVLAFVTLVPFSFHNTVGYEVAIAGVDKDLAMDSEKVDELMTALGLGDVNVEVGDCEKTCVLKLSALKDEGQVNIVVSAFDKLGNCVVQNVSEIQDTESASLLQQAHKTMFISQAAGASEEDVQKFVINALCLLDSTSGGTFGIWIADDNDTMVICNGDSIPGSRIITFNHDTATSRFIMDNGEKDSITICVWNANDSTLHSMGNCLTDTEGNPVMQYIMQGCGGDKTGTEPKTIIRLNDKGDGDQSLVVTDRDGMVHEFDLNDPELEQKLKALGIAADFGDSGQEGRRIFVCRGDGSTTKYEYDRSDDQNAADFQKAAEETPLPDGFELKQNHPNPFNPNTEIGFAIPEAAQVQFEVFNVNGQKVRTLIDAVMSAGSHKVTWDGTDDSGEAVASGVYLYRLTSGDVTTSKKMTLLK